MEDIFSIVVFVITSAVLIIVLRSYDGGIAFMLTIAAVVVLLLMILPTIFGLVESLQGISDLISQGSFEVVIKAIGISILTQLTSDLCIDAGQRAMGNIVQLAGKVAIVVSAFPLLGELLSQLLAMLG